MADVKQLTVDTYTPACEPPDKYDKAVMYLLKAAGESSLEFSHAVYLAWSHYISHEAGCLFGFCAPNPACADCYTDHGVGPCGCLTQVRRYGDRPAATPKLTAEIKADERIPLDWSLITPNDLPVFAEWQRRLDEELNRPK